MTGTGTQTDPYYPTNWSEFVTAIGQSGVYIECPENGIWDMNEMLPYGLTSTINLNAKQINGNNLSINNLYFYGGRINLAYNSNSVIQKLNFTNISTYGSHTYCFYIGDSGIKFDFKNCEFTGAISAGKFAYCGTNMNSRILFTHDGNKSCGFNMEFLGSGEMTYGSVYYDYCNIEINGTSSASNDNNGYYNKCYISGKLPWRGGSFFSGDDNVFDIEVPQGATIGTSYKTNVINSDKANGRYSTNSSYDKFIKVTETQLSDAAYLRSKGFSIAG